MPAAQPYFFSFAQFLAAPREGKLLDALRRLPQRPLTQDELNAQVKVDEAAAQLQRFQLGYLLQNPEQRHQLGPRLKPIWDRYEQAREQQLVLWKALKTDQQRWLYDEAVKAGVIVPPQTVPDPRGDLEKEEEKARKQRERDAQKAADKLLPTPRQESVDEMLPETSSGVDGIADWIPDAVEDAALDYVENAVGRFYFKKHWKLHRNPQKLSEWLAEQGYAVDTDLVLRELDRLAQEPAWRS